MMQAHNHCIELFGSHGSCWGWDGPLVWMHTFADATIALAYFAIPAALFYLGRKYRVKRLSRVFYVYALFIFGCGLTHVFDVVTVWHGGFWLYLVDGLIRTGTGIVSVCAATVTVKCTPFALSAFTRLAVFERRAGERLDRLDAETRFKTPEDLLWRSHLAEMRDIAKMAREVVTSEEV